MPTKIQDHAVTGGVASLAAAIIYALGVWIEPALFSRQVPVHVHPQYDEHEKDPRPHVGADERLRKLEQALSAQMRSIQHIERSQDSIDAKIDLLLTARPHYPK